MNALLCLARAAQEAARWQEAVQARKSAESAIESAQEYLALMHRPDDSLRRIQGASRLRRAEDALAHAKAYEKKHEADVRLWAARLRALLIV